MSATIRWRKHLAAIRIRHDSSGPISGNGQRIATGASGNISLNASAVIHVRIPLLYNSSARLTAVDKGYSLERRRTRYLRTLIPCIALSQHRAGLDRHICDRRIPLHGDQQSRRIANPCVGVVPLTIRTRDIRSRRCRQQTSSVNDEVLAQSYRFELDTSIEHIAHSG